MKKKMRAREVKGMVFRININHIDCCSIGPIEIKELVQG